MTLAPAAPPALPDLPVRENRDWYAHYQGLDGVARAAVPRVVTPEAYGAVGDGVADDQAALQRMLDALREGDRILLAGQYRRSGVLRVMVPRTSWTQLGRLIATDSTRAAVQLGPEAWGTTWTGLWHEVDWGSTTPVRGGTDILTAGLAAWDTHSLDIRGLTSVLSRQTGMYLSTVRRSRFSDIDVRLSRADSIHLTHACEDILLERMRVTESGDDALAVVSYLRRGSNPDDPAVGPCRRILARGLVARFSHARGATILGGEDITFTDLDVAHTRAAGLYMGSESGYQTHSPVRCIMRGGPVRDVGYPVPPLRTAGDDPALDHGHALLLSQQPTPVTDCWYEDLEVSGGGDPVFGFNREIRNGDGAFVRSGWRRIRATTGRERRSGGIALYGPHAETGGITRERVLDQRIAPAAGSATTGAARRGTPTEITVSANSVAVLDLSQAAAAANNFDVGGYFAANDQGFRVPAGAGGPHQVSITAHLRRPSGETQNVSSSTGAFILAVNGNNIGEVGWPSNADYRAAATWPPVQLAAGDLVQVRIYAVAATRVNGLALNTSAGIVRL